MRIAIIHDWLTGMRGGEKCLEIFCELFPEATIFTLLHNKGSVSQTIEKMHIRTSFIQNLPFAANKYRNYLPLFPRAIESFDLKSFDFILSSSHCVAKGVSKPQGVFHLCYCYTPMRYIWVFFEQYFGAYPLWKKKIVTSVTKRLKKWDLETSKRVDEFIAISKTVEKRINDIYQSPAQVIYPPVDVDKFSIDNKIKKEDFYLCVSALVPYKRIDILIDSFNKLSDKRLIIVGEGDCRVMLEKKIISDKIKIIGWATDNGLKELYQKARAFVYPAEEDFGIAPVEAQAAGLPVIAYAKGGVSETVIPLDDASKINSATGIFFKEQSSDALIEAMKEFEKKEKEFDPESIRKNSLRFSKDNFRQNIKNAIRERLK